MVKEIPLQNGMVALVDDEDFEKVNVYKWCLSMDKENSLQVENGNVTLEKFILEPSEGLVATRKKRNVLDYTRKNLIVLERSKLTHTSRGAINSSSQYKGVSKKGDKWRARIGVNGSEIYLGTYESQEAAALAYNRAALDYFGEHAFINVIGEDNNTAPLHLEKRVQHRSPSKRKSIFRGITWNKKSRKWQSQVHVKEKCIKVGNFKSEIEAAKAYDSKAYEIFGDKAILNFPNEIGGSGQ